MAKHTAKKQRVNKRKAERKVLSASDSDETDQESLARKKVSNTRNVSASDSDETDQEMSNNASKANKQQVMSASDSDDTDNEKRRQSPKAKKQQVVSLSSSSSDSSSDSDSDDANHKKRAQSAKSKKQQAMSASDSDETDNEKRTQSAKAKKQQVMSSSDSDSDDTDNEKRARPAKAKKQQAMSASDSDDTDNEKRTQSAKAKKQQVMSDSDSDDTDNEKRTQSRKKKIAAVEKDSSGSDSSDDDGSTPQHRFRTSKYIHNSSSSSSSSDSEDKSNNKGSLYYDPLRKARHLVSNRISFRPKKEIDPSKPASVNYANRLNDSFVPYVPTDFFISDSDSETDSGEDYDTRDYSPWQRTLSSHRNPKDEPWPKQRRFGYSDKIKLEKRIKKICRRENLSFADAQEIFSSSQPREHIRFFQKIAKSFPDLSLHMLAKLCKDVYHPKRNPAPWTEEEVKELERLIKIHGNDSVLISNYMNRSPKNINDFLYSCQLTKKAAKHWSKEEDEKLAAAVAKERSIEADRISFQSIEPLFHGERSQKQIYARYHAIKHRIKPDGTLENDRRATVIEELNYLEGLLKQAIDHNLIEESQLDFSKDRGFVKNNFYLKARSKINGFEKMKIKDILNTLIERQKRVVESRRAEGLL